MPHSCCQASIFASVRAPMLGLPRGLGHLPRRVGSPPNPSQGSAVAAGPAVATVTGRLDRLPRTVTPPPSAREPPPRLFRIRGAAAAAPLARVLAYLRWSSLR